MGGVKAITPVFLEVKHPSTDSLNIILTVYDKDNNQLATKTITGSRYGYEFDGSLTFTVDSQTFVWNMNRNGLSTGDNYINATINNGTTCRWNITPSGANLSYSYTSKNAFTGIAIIQGSITEITITQ